jgi:hypothetical protein
MQSGTNTHNTAETFTVFPRASVVSTYNIPLSGANTSWYAEIPLCSVLHFVGSGLGSSTIPKAGREVNIIYRI